MRIVIDMQGAQSESRYRGIGRYTMSFARAVARNRGDHEVMLALNGLFPETIEPIRAAFDGLLPADNIRVWYSPAPIRFMDAGNTLRRQRAALMRESFLASLQPDIVHVCSLQEGYMDDCVTSVNSFDVHTRISTINYDLIPLVFPDLYFEGDDLYKKFYQKKMCQAVNSDLVFTISEDSKKELLKYAYIDEKIIHNISSGYSDGFQIIERGASQSHELLKNLNIKRSFVMYAGGGERRKNLESLIGAYALLPLETRLNHQLVLVGKMPKGNVDNFKAQAELSGLKKDELVFTGYVAEEGLVQLYNLCRLFVLPSWREGFGLPVLEAMACGAPVIASNTSSLPEVVGLEEALFDPFDVHSIAEKMHQSLEDEVFLSRLRAHGRTQIKKFSWDQTARKAIAAWESVEVKKHHYLDRPPGHDCLLQAVAKTFSGEQPQAEELLELSLQLAKNQAAGIERQLFLDISELHKIDSETGVQRVVRNYLLHLLESPPPGFRVEPVFATMESGYRYARVYTNKLLGSSAEKVENRPMSWQQGDVFFALDMQHHVQLAHQHFYQKLRNGGVVVKFLLYDVLPLQFPGLFKAPDAGQLHQMWLELIAKNDGVICISKATADAFDAWVQQNKIQLPSHFVNTWVHLGAGMDKKHFGKTLLSVEIQEALNATRRRPGFLAVGTIEPRKMQGQILGAIEKLWGKGIDFNLFLVGKRGWKTEGLLQKITNHVEYGERLFWLQEACDTGLEKIYQTSTCLIAASLDEGFGLPLVEAASYGIPVIARDIPVFREVAGSGAFYFEGESDTELADSLVKWYAMYQEGTHPQPSEIKWSTWQEAAENLKKNLFAKGSGKAGCV